MSKWVNTSLGTLGKFSTSSVDKKILFGQKIVRLVNYMDVYNSNSIDSTINFMYVSASEVERARSQVKVGDILFTPSSETPDDIGYSAVVCENLENTLHSYHTVRYRPYDDQTFDIRFSAWFCNSIDIRKQFEQKCAGSTRYTLSIPSFTAVQISIPESKKEQRKIAKYLDIIQLTIEKTEALIAKYQLIKAGLMQDLFTRGIEADGKLRPTREQAPELYHETKIGWIPKDWVCDEIKNFVTSAQYGVSISLSDEENGIPVLRMNNIKNNKFDVSDLKYSNSVEASTIKIREGDVLYNRTNSMEHVGKTAIWRNELSECSFASYLVRMNLKVDILLPDFFSHWMSQDSSQIALRRYATPAVQQVNINPTNVQKVLIACPKEIAEQQIIFEKIDAIDLKIFAEEDMLLKLEKQKQGLMHDLLTGKKRVTVDECEAEHV